jgi:hypothetical protein
MSEPNSAEPASEPLRLTVDSERKPTLDAHAAQPPAALLAKKRPLWMWIAGAVCSLF